MNKNKRANNPAWQSMLANYELDEVARHCLQLQQELDVDVVLLLFVVYLSEQGFVLNLHQLAALDLRLKPVREQIILPLRQARQACKTLMGADFPAYQVLLGQELEFEWQQCLSLQEYWSVPIDAKLSSFKQALKANLELLAAYYPRAEELHQTWFVLIELLTEPQA